MEWEASLSCPEGPVTGLYVLSSPGNLIPGSAGCRGKLIREETQRTQLQTFSFHFKNIEKSQNSAVSFNPLKTKRICFI
jgi:hypothetical protein